MVGTLANRVNRLEQAHPQLTGPQGIEAEHYLLDPARPELGSFERHRNMVPLSMTALTNYWPQ